MRTIDADALLKVLGLGANCEECEESVRGVYCAANPDLMDVCDAIADAPTIEPKKGRWIYHEPLDVFECSVCGRQMVRNIFNYCPWCGAKMERSEDETD